MLSDTQQASLAQIQQQIDGGQAQEALAALDTLQHEVEGPGAAQVFYARGLAQEALGQGDDAQQSFMTAYSIVRFGRDTAARRLLGKAAEKVGQKDEAVGAYEAILQAEPGDAEATAALARLRG